MLIRFHHHLAHPSSPRSSLRRSSHHHVHDTLNLSLCPPPATHSIGSISNTMPPPLVLPPRPCFPFVPTTVVMPPHVTPPAFEWCPSWTFLCLERPSPFCHPSRLPTALWPAPRPRSIVAACSAVLACLHLRLRGYVYARLPYELLCIRRHWESWGISLPF